MLAAAILGTSMAFLDGTVVNVSLPALQAAFHASVADVQWIVEAYALTLAALLLVGGSLGDIFGRRRVFVTGVGIFAAASAVCGLSQSIGTLICARSIQGVGAALLVPGSLALITALFPEETRGRAIGTWSGFTAMTATAGPVLGGWLVEHSTWRWIFFLNLPLAVMVFLLCLRVPESFNKEASHRVDWAGGALATLGLFGVTYALIEWPHRDPARSSLLVTTAVVGVAGLVAFLVVELRSRAPMLPLGLFRSRNFLGGNLLTLFLYAALGGVMFFFPMNLIQIRHETATRAGAAFLPFIVIMFGLSRWAGGLVDRFGSRIPLTVGPIITGCGYVLMAFAERAGSYWVTYFPAVVVMGIGMTICVAPLTTTVMNAVPETESGVASGINNAVSRLASLLAVAVLGAILVTCFNHALDRRLAQRQFSPEALARVASARDKLAGAHDPDPGLERAIEESFSEGYRLVIWIAAGLALLGGVGSLFLIDPKASKISTVRPPSS